MDYLILTAGQNVDVTVVILTFNGQKYLASILDSLRTQKSPRSFEVLVIDSGSTDETLEILSSYQEVRVHQIPNEEFGHGRTRNLAAQLARGRFVVFLTHDAIPAHEYWLESMVCPLEIFPGVVAVMGKQIPRHNCPPITRYEIERVFAQFGPDFGTTIFQGDEYIDSQGWRAHVTFYSDVNSATSKAFLLDVIPYRDVAYSEDQYFGQDLIEAGYKKAYSARAAVVHSNDLSIREFAWRAFDEMSAIRQFSDSYRRYSLIGSFLRGVKGVGTDFVRILRDGTFGWKRRLYWLAVNPMFHVAKWVGIRRAQRPDALLEKNLARYSLESRLKRAT